MKKYINKYPRTFGAKIILACLLLVSCEDYLDKAPEADITEQVAYGNFISFQGFIEEMYNCIMDPNKGGAWNKYLFADETLNNYPYAFDNGNYWGNEAYFYGQNVNTTDNNSRTKRIWEYAWYAIRKSNLALEKLEEEGLFQGTEEEKALLKGQAHFFRGWFYFEICRYWGGMPYITRALSPTEELTTEEFRRLNFQETALLMAADFRKAADLLPTHWDNTPSGQATLGHNDDRINKFHALGYLGKSLLYAGSPMINEEAKGSNSFDAALCQQAAEAFGELLTLSEQTGTYKLQSWESWTDNFWRWNYERPGGTEVIMRPTIFDRGRVRWSTMGATMPSSFSMNSGSNAEVPAHSFTKNYGMANGLPIDDPMSGYDPNDPWTGREPRFYKDIVVDGDRIHSAAGSDRFAQLYNGGFHRSQINPPSVTGYYYKRYTPMGEDFSSSKANGLQAYIPYLRLADIYLMYAEAVNFASNGGPNSTSGNFSLTAVEAVNKIRNRANLPDLDEKFTGSKDELFEAIVRERAVELAFEGARFCDLRRWNRNGDPRYLDKTAIDFNRGPDGKPINIVERVVVRRTVEKKHNWLPIQIGFTRLYEGFPQNPGW
ncbi:putative outer membrane starch-binding protein [Dyadobacter jejuensis]|uniref:Putative outer membrane starch-binding protein n=1 Tax=Dyadobacter jejuensis TaxID=1082580 RepID=A0A316AGK4_9BACT|nr:RagB/SusD family nutrient uptake outer membrane protein [Dyadobacter jejuensis]PWJ56925.1 putative outer membrane starch-binding protein [Dyadobacter jejuensis]